MFYRPTAYERRKLIVSEDGEIENSNKLFGSLHSLAIRGIEIKTTKSILSLNCDGKDRVEDESGLPLLRVQKVDVAGEEECSRFVQRMGSGASVTTQEYKRVTDKVYNTEAAGDLSQTPKSLADFDKHYCTEARLTDQSAAVGNFQESTGVVVENKSLMELFNSTAGVDISESIPTACRDVIGNALSSNDHDYETTATSQPFQPFFSVMKAASSSQDSPRSSVRIAAASSNFQRTASCSDVQKTALSSNVQRSASSSNVRKTASNFNVQKTASNVQIHASSSNIQKMASSPSSQKAALNRSLRGSTASGWEHLQDMWKAYRTVLSNRAFMCYSCSQLAAHVTMSGVYLHLPEFSQSCGSTPHQAAVLFVAVGVLR